MRSSPSRTRFSWRIVSWESAAAISAAAPPERMIRRGGQPRADIPAARPSMAPMHPRIAPGVIPPGVLPGRGSKTPPVRRSPAGPRAPGPPLRAGPRHVRGDRGIARQRGTQRLVEPAGLRGRDGARRAPCMPVVHAPFDAGVARIDGEENGVRDDFFHLDAPRKIVPDTVSDPLI